MKSEYKKTSIVVIGPPRVGITSIVEKLKYFLGEEEYIIEDLAGMFHYNAIPNSVLRSDIIIIVFDMSQNQKNEQQILQLYYKVQDYRNKIVFLGNKKDITKLTKKQIENLKSLISFDFYGEISIISDDLKFNELVEWIKNNKSQIDSQDIRIKVIREETYQYSLCGGPCGIPGDIYRFKSLKKK